jgi:hypothetical protein
MACPIPVAAPVMIATRFFSCIAFVPAVGVPASSVVSVLIGTRVRLA